MKKIIKTFIFLFLFIPFLTANLFAQATVSPPTVTTPVIYWQNCPKSLSVAITSSVGTLNWYTVSSGGAPLSGPPTPNTSTIGSTVTYYVTQTVGTVESTPRTPIVVKVEADSGATFPSLRCDSSFLSAAEKNSAVYFDWANDPLSIDDVYIYSCSIQGGSAIGGTTSSSSLKVSGLLPGQSVTMTLTSSKYPCKPTATQICSVPCPSPKPTPNFAPITQKYCEGATIPAFSDTSPNGFKGKWTPDPIVNTVGVTKYTFTPNDLCANTQDLFITVLPNDALTFTSGIKANVCENEVYSLPIKSNNTNPVTGSWSPSTTVDTSVIGLTPVYTFKPNSGECYDTSVPLPQVSINVKPSLATSFVSIPPFCEGIIPAPSFPIVTSVPTTPGGISGNWVPSTISTDALPPNQEYQFTPTTECATTPSKLIVDVTPSPIPSFSPIVPEEICEGISFSLSNTSNDTPPIKGSWEIPPGIPVTSIDTSVPGTETYTFIPDSGQCAKAPDPIDITVHPSNTLIKVDYDVTDAFEDNQIITVLATDVGNYLYQLDSGPLQTSNVFENVSAGTHTITVSDANGCSASKTETNVLVIKHPKYFTPNGDGFNDSWKISGLSSSLINKIYIFDRYGKLLKEIATDGTGWDGTYLGIPMPADDYWFTVDYAEDLLPKKFKSHFTLKR